MGFVAFIIIVGILIYEAIQKANARAYVDELRKQEGKPPFDWKKYE